MKRLSTRVLTTLVLIYCQCNAMSIKNVSETVKDDPKDAAQAGPAPEFFPDWVPFKNKHGEQLGEFVDVKPKAKVKKRLALPANFVLKALAEGDEGYDYFVPSSDNEDYFDKKDWSDTNRPVLTPQKLKEEVINHTDLSEIDGVVKIIKEINQNPTTEVTKKMKQRVPEYAEYPNESEESTTEVKLITTEDAADYGDVKKISKDKTQSDEDSKETDDEKKAKVLKSVDELKDRHEKEQKIITEKSRIFKDDYADADEDYAVEITTRKKEKIDYGEYDYKMPISQKYLINQKQSLTSPLPITDLTESASSVETTTLQTSTEYVPSTTEEILLSKETTSTPKSKYNASEESDVISLVPEGPGRTDAPALFFPKMKKKSHKRTKQHKKRKNKKTTATTEYTLPQYQSLKKDTTVHSTPKSSNTDQEQDAAGSHTAPSAIETQVNHEHALFAQKLGISPKNDDTVNIDHAQTGDDGIGLTEGAQASNTLQVTDAVPASTDHEKAPENVSHERGGGHNYHSEHKEETGEHGEKAYEGHHDDTKAAKGHHDKEHHRGSYDDHGGHDKRHHDESGHYGEHHHEEIGKKHAKYEESGKHSKGHSTKGSHDIHKKEEFEKKVEFFEEDGDSGEEEKHGGYQEEKNHKKGGKYHKGNLDAAHHHRAKGETGNFEKGGHAHSNKGYSAADGVDWHAKKGGEHQRSHGKNRGTKWIFHHAHTPTTARLAAIDRRAAIWG